MSKRLFIVVEGQTEQEFVNSILLPYLQSKNILDVKPILIKTSKIGRGGFVSYYHLKNTVDKLLHETQSSNIVVTTFVDFFRIPNNMPEYEECMCKNSHSEQANALEQALSKDINDRRFVPYIQLHEFEALLFSNNSGFEKYFDVIQSKDTLKIIKEFDNPEDINNKPATSPSKRLLHIKHDYDKVIEGNLMALEVGIGDMLKKCPRFAKWLSLLVDECSVSDV